MLHKLKVFLLSNAFMARLSCLFNFPKYIQNLSEKNKVNIKEFMDEVNFENPYCTFLTM